MPHYCCTCRGESKVYLPTLEQIAAECATIRAGWTPDRFAREEGYSPAVAQVVGYDDLHIRMHPFQATTTLEDFPRSEWARRLKARHARTK